MQPQNRQRVRVFTKTEKDPYCDEDASPRKHTPSRQAIAAPPGKRQRLAMTAKT